MHAAVTENYLKAIFHLSNEGRENVSTSSIAEALEIKAPTVSDMMKKLKEKKLITYQKYKGVALTEEGRRIAIRTIRKHRIWEVFLVDKLHFKWDEVHEIAEQLEHIHSVELTNRMDEFLGFPKFDPHGDPIPDAEGNIEDNRKMTSVSRVSLGESGVIAGVNDTSTEFLQFLDAQQLNLGNTLRVIEKYEYDKSVKVEVNGNSHTLSEKVAENICIKIS